MRIWKKIISVCAIGAVSCTAVYYSVLIAIPCVIDLNKYKASVSKSIEDSTGFKVTCEDISFKRSLTPYLKINMFHTLILYPDDKVFLKLKEAELKVKILPLIQKKIVIKDAKLTRPIINITLYKDFSTSLEKYIDISKTINTNGFKLSALINDTICENYKIKYKDESINKTFYLEGDKLLIKDIKPDEKAHAILKGAVYESEKEYIKYDIDVISALNSKERHFTFSPFKTILDSGVKGEITGKIKIDKENNINGSLKIDNLTMKFDNVISSNNKADLIFKGQEVEIDSVIRTSKTDTAKVTGKFIFGRKKYIDLNTDAQNIDLENLTKIISKISKILNIKNPLSDIKAKGLINADFNIKSDFKKLKSSGKAQISGAELIHKSLPCAITDINAYVNFENNNILIEKAQAKINQTPIELKGNINNDVSYNLNIFSENLNLANTIKLLNLNKKIPFNITDGKLSFNSGISGILNKTFNIKTEAELKDVNLKEEKYNTSALIKSINMRLETEDKKIKGEILCADTALRYKKQNISAKEFKINFDENKITIPENTLFIPTELKISGIINEYNKKPSGNISLNGAIPANITADILKPYINLPNKASGNILSEFKIDFTEGKANIKSTLKADENNYISYIVIKELLKKPSDLNIDCEISNNTINIKNLSLNETGTSGKQIPVITTTGQIINSKTPILKNVKITIPNPITIASNFTGGEEISFNGDFLLNKTIQKPEIKGSAKILKCNIKKYLTSIKNADISFNNDNIRLIAPDTTVNNSAFNIIADISPSFDMKNIVISNLQVNSLNLDLNSLYSIIEKEYNPFAQSILTVKKGIVTVNNLKVLDLKAKDISCDIQIANNILNLSNIAATAYNGQIKGKIDYDIPHSELNIDMTGKGLDIKNSLYDLCKLQDDIDGKYDFWTKITLNIGKYNEVLKSLNGILKFNAYNGKLGTLGKFEYYLYAQNLLYHGILNATLNRLADAIVRENTAQYKQANGSILFQNGYMITEDIETIGTNMSLYMKGRHNLLTNQANIDIFGRISDEVKNKLGSFGNTSISEIINGQENKKNVSVVKIQESTVSKIPDLYAQESGKSNTFKVNIYGNINSLNSINSFEWIIPYTNEDKNNDKLPEFSDIFQDL